MTKSIGIIDYGVGNIRSVYFAVEAAGGRPVLVDTPEAIAAQDSLILPGVGAFAHTSQAFGASGLRPPVLDAVEAGVPLLGICVGMQLLFEESHEFGVTAGLGLLKGTVRRISLPESAGDKAPLPVIGWFRTNELEKNRRGFYFLHSYAASPTDAADILQTYTYSGVEVIASVKRGNVMGTQYHPERSAQDGLRVLSRFVSDNTIVDA